MQRTKGLESVSVSLSVGRDKLIWGVSCLAFPAKYDGTAGHIILEPRNDSLVLPQLSFVPIAGREASFTLPIDDIVEIKKVSPEPYPLIFVLIIVVTPFRHTFQWVELP
jgi:hypothetical protein